MTAKSVLESRVSDNFPIYTYDQIKTKIDSLKNSKMVSHAFKAFDSSSGYFETSRTREKYITSTLD